MHVPKLLSIVLLVLIIISVHPARPFISTSDLKLYAVLLY